MKNDPYDTESDNFHTEKFVRWILTESDQEQRADAFTGLITLIGTTMEEKGPEGVERMMANAIEAAYLHTAEYRASLELFRLNLDGKVIKQILALVPAGVTSEE